MKIFLLYMRIIIKFHFLTPKYSIWSYQLNSYTVQLVHKLHGEWVQTFGAAMSGIVWVDKLMIDLCCLEYHQYKGNVSGIVKVWKKKKNEKRKKPVDDYKHGYILKT